MTPRWARSLAATLGGAVLAWQVWNAYRGVFVHRFLAADLVVGGWLIVASSLPSGGRASTGLLVGFSAMGGVFLSASTAGLLVDGFNPGTVMAALGIVPCTVGIVGIILAQRPTTPRPL